MISVSDYPETHTARIPVARKKITSKQSSVRMHQMNIRVPDDVFQTIEEIAEALGVDATGLVRMIIRENIAPYKERAAHAIRNMQRE